MAGMFDQVAPRYELLNRLMTLGQDRSWREAMWRSVPESARTVLDLCTGNGDSLEGLRRPGRRVLGVDVSLAMLQAAAHRLPHTGWAPRLACADAFRLPLRDASLDAVTIAFGIRNLRPRTAALVELARVLRPGGTLVVLEATAPARGWFAPFHRLHLRHGVPLLGRLSPDPSAYTYLSASILEFGSGADLEREVEDAGLTIVARRRFLLGASRLWTARLAVSRHQGQIAAVAPPTMQNASSRDAVWSAHDLLDAERRVWRTVQMFLAGVLAASLAVASFWLVKFGGGLPLAAWQRGLGLVLAVLGTVAFALRALAILGELRDSGPRA